MRGNICKHKNIPAYGNRNAMSYPMKTIHGMRYLLFYSLGSLPTPIIRNLGNTAWNFTSPDGSRVEKYIIEFECRVRNMTFVEKYVSVSASGGTGRVATSVPCCQETQSCTQAHSQETGLGLHVQQYCSLNSSRKLER